MELLLIWTRDNTQNETIVHEMYVKWEGEGSLKCVLMWPGINVTCKMEGQSTRVLYILLRWRERQRDDLACI